MCSFLRASRSTLSSLPRLLFFYGSLVQFVSAFTSFLLLCLYYVSGGCHQSYYLVGGGCRKILEEYASVGSTCGTLTGGRAIAPSIEGDNVNLVKEEDVSHPLAKEEHVVAIAIVSSDEEGDNGLGGGKWTRSSTEPPPPMRKRTIPTTERQKSENAGGTIGSS